MTEKLTVHIVLLRGINVGTSNRIAMAELRTMLTALGYTGVRTLLNSGNAVITTSVQDPALVANAIQKGIKETFGLTIKTIVRSRAQVERVIQRNPLPNEAAQNSKFFHIGFCDPAPEPDSLDAIDKTKLGRDQVVLDEGTLYLWFADGLRNSPLGKALSANKLDKNVTMRNWNTVRKLLALTES